MAGPTGGPGSREVTWLDVIYVQPSRFLWWLGIVAVQAIVLIIERIFIVIRGSQLVEV